MNYLLELTPSDRATERVACSQGCRACPLSRNSDGTVVPEAVQTTLQNTIRFLESEVEAHIAGLNLGDHAKDGGPTLSRPFVVNRPIGSLWFNVDLKDLPADPLQAITRQYPIIFKGNASMYPTAIHVGFRLERDNSGRAKNPNDLEAVLKLRGKILSGVQGTNFNKNIISFSEDRNDAGSLRPKEAQAYLEQVRGDLLDVFPSSEEHPIQPVDGSYFWEAHGVEAGTKIIVKTRLIFPGDDGLTPIQNQPFMPISFSGDGVWVYHNTRHKKDGSVRWPLEDYEGILKDLNRSPSRGRPSLKQRLEQEILSRRGEPV